METGREGRQIRLGNREAVERDEVLKHGDSGYRKGRETGRQNSGDR